VQLGEGVPRDGFAHLMVDIDVRRLHADVVLALEDGSLMDRAALEQPEFGVVPGDQSGVLQSVRNFDARIRT
jgi:hypothetical protein